MNAPTLIGATPVVVWDLNDEGENDSIATSRAPTITKERPRTRRGQTDTLESKPAESQTERPKQDAPVKQPIPAVPEGQKTGATTTTTSGVVLVEPAESSEGAEAKAPTRTPEQDAKQEHAIVRQLDRLPPERSVQLSQAMLRHSIDGAAPEEGAYDLPDFTRLMLTSEQAETKADQARQQMARWIQGQALVARKSVHLMVMRVLRESYLLGNTELLEFSNILKKTNERRRKNRDLMTTARKRLADSAGGEATEPLPWEEVGVDGEIHQVANEDGTPRFASGKEELQEYIKVLEERQNTLGSDAQLMQVDLQQALQKQQQMLQTMSNVAKLLHDVSMAILRKIAG